MKKNNYFQNVFDQQLEVLVIGDLKKKHSYCCTFA